MKRRCVCCKDMFTPDRYHPNQNYCRKKECQRSRRTTWQKNKLKTDPDYRENQAKAQAHWKKNTPEYWKNYRATHPAYAECNRIQQRRRRCNGRKTVSPVPKNDVAKMDFALLQHPIVSGNYRLTLLNGPGVAKMDVAIVQLTVLEPVTKTG